MPFKAEIYRVFIASPHDLEKERQAATDAIHEWNEQHAVAESVVLLPVKWETHAMPQTGERPQKAINRQLVGNCDLLLGMFWTRIGKNGVAESGTVDEIDQFVAARKPAMLYFSNRYIDPRKIDTKQLAELKDFKGLTYDRALVGEFGSISELRRKLLRHLLIQVRELRKNKGRSESTEAKAAIKLLLGMSEGAHYQVGDAVAGEYFGYRRSANHGNIIRFYIKIERAPETGLLSFKNRFRRGRLNWIVDGVGFDVGEISYLMGQAKTDSGKRAAFGMRFFALTTYRSFDWYVGPLISMDDNQDPIAARVVLVPADQHKRYHDLSDDNRDEVMLRLIENRVTPDEIDEDIELLDVDGRNAFGKICPSIHIQALIWNASFTTLHARQGVIDSAAIHQYKALFEFQQRAIDLARFTRNDMVPFVRIAAHSEQIIPINNRLSDYERSEGQ